MLKFKGGVIRNAGRFALGVAAVAIVAFAPSPAVHHYTDQLRGSLTTTAISVEEKAAQVLAQVDDRHAAETRCLAEAMYYEARGEGMDGQRAVAEVVIQRTQDRYYPKSICGVVYQGAAANKRSGCQFSFACDGSARRPKQSAAWRATRNLAKQIISGDVALNETGRAVAFHSINVFPGWAETMVRTAQIGNHVFYRRAPFGVTTVNAPMEEMPRSGELLDNGIVVPVEPLASIAGSQTITIKTPPEPTEGGLLVLGGGA